MKSPRGANARSTTLTDLSPVSVGRVLKPMQDDQDLLGAMLECDLVVQVEDRADRILMPPTKRPPDCP